MVTYPISSNLCKKNFSAVLSALQFFISQKLRRRRKSSVKKGVLRNVAKFTGKHLWQSLFFNKVAG